MSDTERFVDFARMRRISSETEVAELSLAAKQDDHVAVLPSHVVTKRGHIVGHFSIGSIPLWQGHLSKSFVTPHDTFRLIHGVELLMQAQGYPLVLTLVGKESGLHKHMSELGYSYNGNADVFVKTL